MNLFQKNNGKLIPIKEKSFKLEKDLQTLIEDNLQELFNLKLIKSEFVIGEFRFDTLAYDESSNSFVIIEYKRDRNSSVIDQGLTYLHTMLTYKVECICEINERLNKSIKRDDIDWSQSRVIFIAASFTEFQKQVTNFKDIPIQLIEVNLFENNQIVINQIQGQKKENIKMLSSQNSTYRDVLNEVKVYTEEQHLSVANEKIKEVYNDFKNAILNLDDGIEIQAKKVYISFKKKTNICDIEIQKSCLKLYLNAKWGKLEDCKKIFQNVSDVGHWGNGDYRISLSDTKDLEYIMSVLKQLL